MPPRGLYHSDYARWGLGAMESGLYISIPASCNIDFFKMVWCAMVRCTIVPGDPLSSRVIVAGSAVVCLH
jgi:hypothetical protein